ncbi:MAG TPA: proton-conducting transporter membrane subunit, partial [Opitutus sp.]|nr:proton-conducting transporter membrane subunit [Opitutus sp.]
RSPVLAGCLLVCLLSLAGVPPLAGFFGKFLVFAAALQTGGVASSVGGLTLAAIALSAVALYYYLLELKQAWVAAPAPGKDRIAVAPDVAVALVCIAGLVLALGLAPSVILRVF